MKSETKVLVIGGGIAGVSTLYHLAKAGWNDVMLVEKLELTSGSTWHAAGNLPHFSTSFNIMKLQQYSIRLYQQLARDTGQSVGHHMTGAVRLAHTKERLDEFKRVVGMGQLAGLRLEMVDNDRLKALYPYLDTTGLLGGLWDPDDGHIDPTSVTNAMAGLARQAGATIVRNNPVTAIRQLHDGRWEVTTEKGLITAEKIVNAAGFRANEIAAMIGHQLPMCSMEHQYLVTAAISELEARSTMLPMLRDPDVSYYLRQEGKGFILGPYEKGGLPWAVDGVPEAFGQELLQPALDRLEDIIGAAMEQVELIGKGGVRTVINGPITYTPDGHPLIGPVHGYDNYYACTGFNFGIVQGGGAGHFMSQWIMNGHPDLDLWELDPRRFGEYANHDYTVAKCAEVYANEYQLGQPNEYAMRPEMRMQKVGPIHASQQAKNAVFGAYYGWERPSWFALPGQVAAETHSFSRGNWDTAVRAECEAIARHVGLLDLSPFVKYEISGDDAFAFLDGISPNKLPTQAGGIALAHPLMEDGGVAWELSVTKLKSGAYYMMGPAAAELMIDDWLRVRARPFQNLNLKNITAAWGTLMIAGPKARELLSRLTDADVGNDAFPWFSGQEIEVAGVPVRALRMNFVGELGWELHHPIESQAELYKALAEAGTPLSLTHFGLRAMDSMRLEKAYPVWGRELTPEFSAPASGLGYFIKIDKGDFEGKAAVVAEKASPSSHRLVLMEVDAGEADAMGSEPVYQGDKVVGQTSSGGYGYRIGKSLAMAFVERSAATAGNVLHVGILGERKTSVVVKGCAYDPSGARMKS
ncbi:MAG: FAD-dependent oxidoreductase [Polaromonas sp.]